MNFSIQELISFIKDDKSLQNNFRDFSFNFKEFFFSIIEYFRLLKSTIEYS